MKTIQLATSLLLSLALPAHALVDSMSMARAFPEGGLKGDDASNVQVAQARELVAKALGDDVRDLVFIPITPCTVWDSRFATEGNSAGPIVNGATRRFLSHLDGAGGDFTPWGGNPACTEANETFVGLRPFAVMMTVYINDASGNGWLTLYRDGDADPSQATISVYYSPGPTRTQTVISKSSRGYGTGTYDIAATSRFASTQASASVTGYFVKPVSITLPDSTATTGNILKGANRFLHNFGTDNTFLGVGSGNFTLSGIANTAIGRNTLSSNTSGESNVAVGYEAALGNTTGIHNTAVGYGALRNNTTANFNTAVGHNALRATTGAQNVALGRNAGTVVTSGVSNLILGHSAGVQLTTGSSNIVIGADAGTSLVTGSNNIYLAHSGSAAETATTRLGSNIQSRVFITGIRGVTTGSATGIAVLIDANGQLGTLSSSRAVKEDIKDMDEVSARLMKLRPVTFHYRSHKAAGDLQPQYGLVAEEVGEQMPELVARNAAGSAETVYYQFLPPMLLNEYQKQQRTIEKLERDRDRQSAEIASLRAAVAEIAQLRQMLDQQRADGVRARLETR